MTVTPELRAYFAAQPPATRRILKSIRATLLAALPDAEEIISYKIPALRSNGRVVIWYAGWREHVSVYPVGPAIVRTLGAEAKGLKTAKGTLRFPLERPPSAALLKKIVRARLAQLPPAAVTAAPSAARRSGTGSRYTSPSRRPRGTSRSRSR